MRNAQEAGNGKVAVITGASAGVGRACAHRFARSGFRLALIGREEAALVQAAAEVSKLGAEVMTLPLDVADADAVFSAAGKVEDRWGPIDVWVNNAMVTVFSPVWELTAEEFRRVTEVTYLGYVHGTMAALRSMRPRGRGVIVQVGSALAYRGIPLQAAYCGAKHAIRGFTDSLRTELIHEGSGIELTMVQLPAVNTPQFDWARTHLSKKPRPAGPMIQPEAAADAILAAALEPRREIWVGQSTINAILGNFINPSFADRYLARTAFDGQQTNEDAGKGREDNLFTAVRGYHRTRGSFGEEASEGAVAASGNAVRLGVATVGLGLVAVSLLALQRLAGSRNSGSGRHS